MDVDNRKMIKKDRHGFALVFPNYCALSVDEIRDIFSRFGQVRSVNLTGDQCGYRFVRYENYDDAKSAIEGLRGHPEINLCTHGPRKKVDGNNNNSSKGNLNAPSVVGSDGSDDWEDSTSQKGARSSRYAESSVSQGYESMRSRKGSGSSSSRPGSLKETAAAAPRRSADERLSAARSEYRANVWEKDRTPAGRSPGQSDADWRATRDNTRSGHFDSARNSSRGVNNQSGAWSGTSVKTEDCPSVWDLARLSDNESTVHLRTVKAEDCAGIWNSAASSNNQSNERSKTVRNDDCSGVWDAAVPWNNQSTERAKNVRNQNCGISARDSDVTWNNQSNERPKNVKNEDCGSVWDSARSSNSRNTGNWKTVKNEDRNSLWGSNRKLNCQSEVNWKTSRRNVKDESVSKSTNNIWDSIKNEQSEKPNQSVQQKPDVRNGDNDKTTKSPEQKRSPKREINLHNRLVKIQSMNNQCDAQESKINAEVGMDDECIPDLVQMKSQVSQKRQEVVMRNAKEVVVGNISEHATPAYILYLLEVYEPIAISCFHSAPRSSMRYCHVYFKKDKDALDVERQFDNYELAGKRLIVSRPNRLTVLAAKD